MRIRTYPQPYSWSSGKDSGFTLLEALVVLSILTLVTAFIVSGLRTPGSALVLQVSALEIASSLRAAWVEALRGKTETEFLIDVENRRYQDGRGQTRKLDPRLSITMLTAMETIPIKGVGRVKFTPTGQSTGATITLSFDQESIAITVDWLTGRVATQAAP